MAVLGISANSRVIGVAVFRSNELHDYSVRLFKESWSELKASKIIASLSPCIRHHSITHVALAIPPQHYQNKETEALIASLKAHFRGQKIPVSEYQLETIYQICPKAKARKKALMAYLLAQYSMLQIPYYREQRNAKRHYFKLFEAVAAAFIHHSLNS